MTRDEAEAMEAATLSGRLEHWIEHMFGIVC